MQIKISRSPLFMCVFLFLLFCRYSLLHAVSGSFRQQRDENTQTELDGLMEEEREWKTAYIKTERWVRDGSTEK